MSKYTFLLPAFKARYFEESLRSILDQSYQDFNVIVSDDCSPDNMKSIVDKFDDKRLTYRRNDTNFGLEHLVDHWNLLVGLADSDYIILASDDDVYDQNYLEQIDNLIRRYPSINIFRPLMRHIDSADTLIRFEKLIGKELLSLEDYLNEFLRGNLFSGLQQFVFNRKALSDIGGFVQFPAAWYSDDATVYSLARDGIVIVNEVLFSMRISGVSISSNTYSPKVVWCKVRASICFIKHLRKQCRDYISKGKRKLLVFRVKKLYYDILMHVDKKSFLICAIYAMVSMPLIFNIRWGNDCLSSYIKHRKNI